jgi:transcriptional regulator GlxA family with amidase domain
MRNIGMLIFDDVEELDFVGPWEVLGYANQLSGRDRLLTLAESPRAVRCAKGLGILPDAVIGDAPPLDVILVPGGKGTRREVGNAPLMAWLRDVAKAATWVTSVCTGSLLLHEAGPARGKRVTTHWSFVEGLRARGDVTVVGDMRWVRDGNLVTAAGVSAGIDMALWLVGQRDGIPLARQVQRGIQYEPAPPYAADV